MQTTESAGRRPFHAAFAAACALLLPLLQSCKTLPDVRDKPQAAVRLQTARGPLSASQSAEILKKLAPEESTALRRHLAVEEAVSESPLVLGNKATLLQDGAATYAAMFASIRAARHHINVETYIIEDDDVGRRFVEALVAQRKRGVEVNLIYDSVGSLSTPRPFFDRLREAGIRVLEFNPVNPLTAKKDWRLNQRDHRKLLVADGRVAYLGGINISSVYSSGSSVRLAPGAPESRLPWRDTHVRLEGPVVADLQRLFMQTWESQGGGALPPRNYFPKLAPSGNEVVRVIGSRAADEHSPIYVTFLSAINSAESSIHLTNAYFVPDRQLLDALKGAAARGVDVKLILPGRTDFWAVFHAGRSFYDELLESGVKIYERREALLHAKTALIDGAWSSIGSANLDWRSFLHNDELNAVVLGADFSREMQAAFDRDLGESEPVTLEGWRKRPLGVRLMEWTARVWQYWL